MQEEFICCECDKKFDNIKQMIRHQQVHNMSFEEYTLKWKYNNVRPVCKCGCGKETNWNVALKDFTTYVHGHNALGHKVTDEMKQKIGRKNSEHQKRYAQKHPEVVKKRIKSMRQGITEESLRKSIEALVSYNKNMTSEDKQRKSDKHKKFWSESREFMNAVRKRGGETFKKRAANGEYDLETRNKKISESVAKLYLDGGQPWRKGNYTSIKTGQTIYYRSSWELQYAQMLDEDQDVLIWEYEWESIPYMLENKQHKYIPDFHVILTNGNHLFVEIKPPALINTVVNTIKRNAALKLCEQRGWKYVEWTSGL